MSQFTITFSGGAEALVTNCIVMPAVDFSKGEKATSYYPTDNAVWDTGADTTIIRKSIADVILLLPIRMPIQSLLTNAHPSATLISQKNNSIQIT